MTLDTAGDIVERDPHDRGRMMKGQTMTRTPNYERRRSVVAVTAAMVAALAVGWALGSWDNARIIDGCRQDPSGIYCTEEDRNP